MKKMIKKASVILTVILGLAIMETGSTKVWAGDTGEHQNVVTIDSFRATLEGSALYGYCIAHSLEKAVPASTKDSEEVESRNVTDLERFAAALKDPASHVYHNLMTLKGLVAAIAMGEDSKASESSKIINTERFVAALRESK